MHVELIRIGPMSIGPMSWAFAALRATAEREGFNFLHRLGARWDGARYMNDDQASVWAAWSGATMAAIGAQTFDEYDPSPLHRRIRHFYVLPEARRHGVGRALAGKLIADAHALAPLLHLRATHALSTAFWDSVGFARVTERADRSHVLVRT